MINKNQVMTKLTELEAYCIANGYSGSYTEFMQPIYLEVGNYFNYCPRNLRDNIHTLIIKLYTDLMMRDTTWERPIGKPLSTDYPEGYFDLTELFDGNNVLVQILNISPESFLAGFPIEEVADSESGTSSKTVLPNPIISTWATTLASAHSTESAGIENIMVFCEQGVFDEALISLFEDRGKAARTKETSDFAKQIYIDMKVKEVINAFNLDIHIPTYL